MRNKIFAVLILALLTGLAAAQTTTVKGKVSDREGKPIDGAKVTFKNLEDGSKYDIKTNKKGEYFSLGVKPGSYDIILSQNGTAVFSLHKVPVGIDDAKNNFDIDLAKEQGAANASAASQNNAVSTDDAAQQAPPPAAQPSGQGVGNTTQDPNAPVVLTEEQQKKLTPEQKKEYEEYRKGVQENMRRKGLNTILKQAQTAAAANDYEQAVTLVKGITQQAPDIALPWAVLGQYQSDSARKMTDRGQRSARFSEAATSFDKALQLASATPDQKQDVTSWRVGYGAALDGAGRYDEAVKAFATAAQDSASNPKAAALAHYNTGLVLTKTGKVDDAAAQFDQAVQLDPTLAEAYYQKGTALIAKATADKAGKIIAPPGTAEAFQKYLELAPNGRNAEAATAQLEFLGQKVQRTFKKQ